MDISFRMDMKILYFVEGIYNKGGIARIVVDKANYLAEKLGYDVTICVLYNWKQSAYNLSHKVKVCKLDNVDSNKLSLLSKLAITFKYYSRLKTLLHELQPDIIVNAQTPGVTWVLPFICKKIPKIMEIHFSYIGMKHNIEDKNRLFQKMYFIFNKHFYKRYSRFVVLTEEDLPHWHLNNIAVIHNFTNLTTDHLSDLKSKRIICVARYHQGKKLNLLIESWARICDKNKDWKVEVFGKGPDKQKLQLQIDELGLTSSFILHDAVDDIKSEYLKSSIFALTSEYEGFALVLLEAMSMGLPICMFNVVGTSWLSNAEQAVLACDFGDIDKFTENLSLLMNDFDLRKKIRDNALKELPKYHIDHIMKQWNDLFEQCIGNYEKN